MKIILILLSMTLISFCIYSQEDISLLKKIDLSDSHNNYEDLSSITKDVTTEDGWLIEYKVKNDETKYDDIYIVVSKEGREGIIKMESFLNFRRYFIPVYKSESDNKIFFDYETSTFTSGIIVIDKKNPQDYQKYSNVLRHNIEDEYLIYCDAYSDKDAFRLEYISTKNNRADSIVYVGACIHSVSFDCVEELKVTNEFIEVTCNLMDLKTGEYRLEKQKMVFKDHKASKIMINNLSDLQILKNLRKVNTP